MDTYHHLDRVGVLGLAYDTPPLELAPPLPPAMEGEKPSGEFLGLIVMSH
jgi:hypothetical protein